jgi:hypothetical protein
MPGRADPTPSELREFFQQLLAFRGTLTGVQLHLLNAMVVAAVRTPMPEREEETASYWHASQTPDCAPDGIDYDAWLREWSGSARWELSPWAVAFRTLE